MRSEIVSYNKSNINSQWSIPYCNVNEFQNFKSKKKFLKCLEEKIDKIKIEMAYIHFSFFQTNCE